LVLGIFRTGERNRLNSQYNVQCAFLTGLCSNANMKNMIKSKSVDVAEYRLNANPPSLNGLSKKSPTTAPKGRVSMKAVQNRMTCDIFVFKKAL